MDRTIGVVLATYDGEQFLSAQLQSIINQSMKPDCIIVSDGGSKDRTIAIANETLNKGSVPYKVLSSNKRLSVEENFEKALSECDTDIIFFSDQDDKWMRTKIERMITYLDNDCVLAFSNAFIVGEDLQHRSETLWEHVGYSVRSEITKYSRGDKYLIAELLKHNIVTGMTMCITDELKSIAMPFPKNVYHDYWLALLGIQFGAIVAIDEPLVLYRQHKNNVVGTAKSFSKSYRKRFDYLHRLESQAAMIENLMEIVENRLNSSADSGLREYGRYLDRRCKYLSDKHIFKNTVPISDYMRFEHRACQVIGRDMFTKIRTIMSRGQLV